jgi:prevent-host-death family protein
MKVNIHEAKTHFSRLLAKVGKGEEVIISKAGKPIARLIPIEEKPIKRDAGRAMGRVIMAEDFDTPLPEGILNSFER